MKRPAFQFYPGDWLRDTALKSCSVAARGLWMDMLCLMHEGVPYGHLKVGDKVILPSNLARMVGATLHETEGWLVELEGAGVFSKTEDGTIYSRRMIRDEEIRLKRAVGGIKGGNPALIKTNGKVNLHANLQPTPSSSSSSAIIPPTPVPASPPLGGGKKDVLPTSPEALAISELFGRKPKTAWSPREITKYRDLIRRQVATLESIAIVTAYYRAERAKGEEGRHRRDLGTFLNNFDGELDRAQAAIPTNGSKEAWRTEWIPWLKTRGMESKYADYQFAPEFLKTEFHRARKVAE